MHVEYHTTKDLDITRIYCDGCSTPIWRIAGRLTDSHLEASSGAVCLCERCAARVENAINESEQDCPF